MSAVSRAGEAFSWLCRGTVEAVKHPMKYGKGFIFTLLGKDVSEFLLQALVSNRLVPVRPRESFP